jgi:hypothetical protein
MAKAQQGGRARVVRQRAIPDFLGRASSFSTRHGLAKAFT